MYVAVKSAQPSRNVESAAAGLVRLAAGNRTRQNNVYGRISIFVHEYNPLTCSFEGGV